MTKRLCVSYTHKIKAIHYTVVALKLRFPGYYPVARQQFCDRENFPNADIWPAIKNVLYKWGTTKIHFEKSMDSSAYHSSGSAEL